MWTRTQLADDKKKKRFLRTEEKVSHSVDNLDWERKDNENISKFGIVGDRPKAKHYWQFFR
jgi:hypothetical protein